MAAIKFYDSSIYLIFQSKKLKILVYSRYKRININFFFHKEDEQLQIFKVEKQKLIKINNNSYNIINILYLGRYIRLK